MDKVEPPLLNRFEKMILYFSEMVKENQRKSANIILNELGIKKYKNKLNYEISYDLEDLLAILKNSEALPSVRIVDEKASRKAYQELASALQNEHISIIKAES